MGSWRLRHAPWQSFGGTTPAGRALGIMAGMGLGKLGSDATQGVFGGMG